MIQIKNVHTLHQGKTNLEIPGENRTIDAKGLTLLPALIDPHVHFRIPGGEHKEDWESASRAAIAGGVTTVFDMPNNSPSCITKERLQEKRQLIEKQLKIPLRFALYLGADQNHLGEIPKVKNEVIGLKIYMGSSTGDLLMKDPLALDEAFRLAAESDLLVAVHAEDEALIEERKCKADLHLGPAIHSVIRNSEVAKRAVEQAIGLAQKYGTRLYIAHVSTKEELDLIRSAKGKGLSVFAEATPHHLFLNTDLYKKLRTRALVNPPLREKTEALWDAIYDGTIDTIGTDHAPHTLEEKDRPYGLAPSGFPSIELYLALLLNAHHEKKISLEQIVSLTHTRPKEIFRWKEEEDFVLVDLNERRIVEDDSLQTKAKWSPYAGMTLTGWPRYTILKGKVYDTRLVS
jgi:dihydroorotase